MKNPVKDKKNLVPNSPPRIVKGGDWVWGLRRTTRRTFFGPVVRYDNVGFRMVRTKKK